MSTKAASTSTDIKVNPELTPEDFAEILTTTLMLTKETGQTVKVGNRTDGSGLFLIISGLAVNEAGQIVASVEGAQ